MKPLSWWDVWGNPILLLGAILLLATILVIPKAIKEARKAEQEKIRRATELQQFKDAEALKKAELIRANQLCQFLAENMRRGRRWVGLNSPDLSVINDEYARGRLEYWDFGLIGLTVDLSRGCWQRRYQDTEVIITPSGQWLIMGRSVQNIIFRGELKAIPDVPWCTESTGGHIREGQLTLLVEVIKTILRQHQPSALAEFTALATAPMR